MAETGITIVLQAVDQTQVAFGSAKAGFVAFSQSLSQTMIGAQGKVGGLGAIGGFWKTVVQFQILRSALQSFNMILGPLVSRARQFAKKMHTLSDLAAESGSSAAQVRLLSHMFDALGIRGSSVENIANILGRMAKATGETGVEGFRHQMKAIAALNSEQERATELMRVFGRTGLTLAPMLRAGPEALDKALGAVSGSLSGLSDGGISAAANIDKGFTAVARDFANQWAQVGAFWAEWLEEKFNRPAEFAIVDLWNRVKHYFRLIRDYIAAMFLCVQDAFFNAFTWKGEWTNYYAAVVDLECEAVAADSRRLDALQAGTEALSLPSLNLDIEEGAEALSAAASKVPDAMNPAKWTDAASYAGQTLVLAAQNAMGRARSIALSGIGPSVGTDSPPPRSAWPSSSALKPVFPANPSPAWSNGAKTPLNTSRP